MKGKKRKKIAKKAFEDFVNSGYVIEQLRQIFMMQDYSDKDIVAALKFAANKVIEANEEKWNFKKSRKSKVDDYDEFEDQSRRTRIDPRDKTKVVGKGRTSAMLEDLDSILG